jgi:hypothetical protein
MAEISSIFLRSRAEAGAKMTVTNPLNPTELLLGADGTPATITLIGIDSKVARRHQHRLDAAKESKIYEKAFNKANDESMDLGNVVTEDDIEARDEVSIDLLVALTVAWSGFEMAGEPFPCTAENARRLYEESPPIRAQADAFVRDRARFFVDSAASSPSTPSTGSPSADV